MSGIVGLTPVFSLSLSHLLFNSGDGRWDVLPPFTRQLEATPNRTGQGFAGASQPFIRNIPSPNSIFPESKKGGWRESVIVSPPLPLTKLLLFEQQHLSDFCELSCLQAVQVNPRRHSLAAVVGRVPSEGVAADALALVHEGSDHLSNRVVYHQLHVRRLWQRVLDRGFRVEGVRVVEPERVDLG